MVSFLCAILLTDNVLTDLQDREQAQKHKANKQMETYIHVYLSKEDRVVRLPLETYIVGVVAAEMPAHFHIESLKAQSLAARTYIVRRIMEGDRLDEHEWGKHAKNAHVSDTVQHQAFLTDQMLRKKWGQDYGWKIKRIRQAVAATKGKIITYQGKPIYAAYFSTSNGWTENSEDYYQTAYPYLRSVSSTWDKESPKYLNQKQITISQFVQALKQKTGKEISLPTGTQGAWIRVLGRTDGNRVEKVMIGDHIFTGRQIREAFQLSSSDFTIHINANSVLFRTRGYGHGVGMSQWGANLMAKQGKKMTEIIDHYYQDVEIVSWNESFS